MLAHLCRNNHSTFIQQNNNLPEDTDYEKLLIELSNLKSELLKQASLPEHFQAIAEVSSAEIAATKKNGNGVVDHLKKSGKWVFDFATKVGTSVVAEIIKGYIR